MYRNASDKTSNRTDVAEVHAEQADMEATMRDGVQGLHLVCGLPEAVCDLSGRPLSALGSRAGLASALAEIRDRYPKPDDLRPRLHICKTTPAAAAQVFDDVRNVMRRDPQAGTVTWRLKRLPNERAVMWSLEISGDGKLTAKERAAWNLVGRVAASCKVTNFRSIKDRHALARLGARAATKWKGKGRTALLRIAAVPRACAPDSHAAAIAYAHAPRVRGSVAVVVEQTTEAILWRRLPTTGIRPINPRSWHPRLKISALMAASAASAIARRAPHHVSAPENATWTQAVLADHDQGFEVYLQRSDGRIDHLDVLGRGSWNALGAEEAAQIAARHGTPSSDHGFKFWPGPENLSSFDDLTKIPADEETAEPEIKSLLENGIIKPSGYRSYQYRINVSAKQATDRAILSFESGLPEATLHLARLINPVRSWDSNSNRRFPLGRRQIDAGVAAAAHRNPATMARAVENEATQILILAAALQGPWQTASDALAAGCSAWDALRLYAEATIGCALPHAALKSLGGWPWSPWYGLDDGAAFRRFSDLGKLAAVLWAATPSRPSMTAEELYRLAVRLAVVGFVPPSVAGPGGRTWIDPMTTTAYADALRCDKADTVGSADLGSGVTDLCRWIDGKLGSIGLTQATSEAVRRVILVPPGRLAAGLERLSDAWHRSINRMSRDRSALVGELTAEMVRQRRSETDQHLPDDYPTPLFAPIVHGEVIIRPLRGPRVFEQEAEEMANCLMSYREDARVGDLLVFSLRSPEGRSTLGLSVHGDAEFWQIAVFQHTGRQHERTDEPPPKLHAAAASWLVRTLDRSDGGPGGERWRERLFEVRAAHAEQGTAQRSEHLLPWESRERLAAFDLAQLGMLLGRNERGLTIEEFRRWATSLAATTAVLDSVRMSHDPRS